MPYSTPIWQVLPYHKVNFYHSDPFIWYDFDDRSWIYHGNKDLTQFVSLILVHVVLDLKVSTIVQSTTHPLDLGHLVWSTTHPFDLTRSSSFNFARVTGPWCKHSCPKSYISTQSHKIQIIQFSWTMELARSFEAWHHHLLKTRNSSAVPSWDLWFGC